MPDYTPHQRGIIKRYYEHRSDLMLQKLGELVSDIMVTDDEKKRKRLWAKAEAALKNLKVPSWRIAKILESQDANLLAEVVKDFF
ncbi:MAG TPA: hypothetical protein VNE39_12325 [Planctomycetota bacterium]|nr:hypothetical protein [Planctomycetota bacterium]